MNEDAAQRKWQRLLGEYAVARVEYDVAFQVFSRRPTFNADDSQSPEALLEQKARGKLMAARDRLSQMEGDMLLDVPGDMLTD